MSQISMNWMIKNKDERKMSGWIDGWMDRTKL